MRPSVTCAGIIAFQMTLAAITGGAANAAAVIKEGPICKTGGGICESFQWDETAPDIGPYTFMAPSAGTALVSFNGQMQCDNASGTDDGAHGVVDLVTQIVTRAKASPDYQASGGAHIALRLPVVSDGGVDYSASVNLASSRVIAVAAGINKFIFKIAQQRMDLGTSCTIFNGNFTVVFVP